MTKELKFPKEKYVTTKDVEAFLKVGLKVRSLIIGAVGRVLLVENGGLYISNKPFKKDPKTRAEKLKKCTGFLYLKKKQRIIFVENEDGSISLWDEEVYTLQPEPKDEQQEKTPCISNDFRSHYEGWLKMLNEKIKQYEDQLAHLDQFENADYLYYKNERDVFKRAFKHLFAQNLPEIEVPKLESELQ